jgi:hypothetical protein
MLEKAENYIRKQLRFAVGDDSDIKERICLYADMQFNEKSSCKLINDNENALSFISDYLNETEYERPLIQAISIDKRYEWKLVQIYFNLLVETIYDNVKDAYDKEKIHT